MTLDRSMDSEAFGQRVEQVLAPNLSAVDVVVMDSLSVHETDAVSASSIGGLPIFTQVWRLSYLTNILSARTATESVPRSCPCAATGR